MKFKELDIVRDARERTFSRWGADKDSFFKSGFTACEVGDRVVCIYCRKVLQGFNSFDEPKLIHKIISPTCPYVKSYSETNDVTILVPSAAELTTVNSLSTSIYAEYTKRLDSFKNWNNPNMPSPDLFAEAGFFYTNLRSIVTCFWCNGSLENWGIHDKPSIEHSKWFPHCQYSRFLIGEDAHKRLQELRSTGLGTNKLGKLSIPNEETLSRYVAARLDLPVVKDLLKKFKLSVIKRCIEDQLRLHREDYTNPEVDWHLACMVLQAQIDIIDGKKENIIVPSKYLPSAPEIIIEKKLDKLDNRDTLASNRETPCILCFKNKPIYACIPCGHLCVCSECMKSIGKTGRCPVKSCRCNVEKVIRVYDS